MADSSSTCIHDKLDNIEQTSTVEEFYHHFEAIRNLVSYSQPWLPESKDIQVYVLKFHPTTVIDAFHLACVYEYNFSLAFTVNHVDYNVNIISVESMGTGETKLAVRDSILVEQHTDEEIDEVLQCDAGGVLANVFGEIVSAAALNVADNVLISDTMLPTASIALEEIVDALVASVVLPHTIMRTKPFEVTESVEVTAPTSRLTCEDDVHVMAANGFSHTVELIVGLQSSQFGVSRVVILDTASLIAARWPPPAVRSKFCGLEFLGNGKNITYARGIELGDSEALPQAPFHFLVAILKCLQLWQVRTSQVLGFTHVLKSYSQCSILHASLCRISLPLWSTSFVPYLALCVQFGPIHWQCKEFVYLVIPVLSVHIDQEGPLRYIFSLLGVTLVVYIATALACYLNGVASTTSVWSILLDCNSMGAVFLACLSAGSLKQNIFKGRVTYIGPPHSVIVIAAYKVMAIVDGVVQAMTST